MSDTAWAALIVGIPLILAALGNFLVTLKTLFVAQATHKEVNSKLTALVKAEKIVSFDAGVTAADATQNVPSYPRPIAPEPPPKAP